MPIILRLNGCCRSLSRRAAEMLFPLREVLREEILRGGYIQADETRIHVKDQAKSKASGKHHLGYYWAYSDPVSRLVIFDYQKGRSRDGPAAFLEGFEGTLQTDGYNVYVSVRESISLRIRKSCTHNIWNESFSKKPDYRTDTCVHFLRPFG